MPKSIAVEPKSTAFEGSEMWLKHSENALFLFCFCHFPQKEEWAETAKGIDNEVNSETNKENMRAPLSLIIDYKY